MINWQELEDKYQKKFKDYAPLGRHQVKVEKATVASTTTGSIRVVFEFQDSNEYKYPKSAAHWISRKNLDWTHIHHRNLLIVLGVSAENAQKAIESTEKDEGDIDKLVKAYQAIYDRACSRHPQVEIEVREQYDKDGIIVTSDKGYAYTESEFTDSSFYSSNKPRASKIKTVESVDDLGGDEISIDELPF